MGPDRGRAEAAFDLALSERLRADAVRRFGWLFRPDELRMAMDQSPASRETLVVMPISDFLSLAAPLHGGADAGRVAGLVGVIRSGGLADVPFLMLGARLDGAAFVCGHEGRHRAHAFRALGLEEMPVRVRATDPVGIRWGETARRPSWILPEDPAGSPARLPVSVTFPPAGRPPSRGADDPVPTPEPTGESIVSNLASKGLDAIEILRLAARHDVPSRGLAGPIAPHLASRLADSASRCADSGDGRKVSALGNDIAELWELSGPDEPRGGIRDAVMAWMVGATVRGDLDLSGASDLIRIPDGLFVDGDLDVSWCHGWDGRIPGGVSVSGRVLTRAHPEGLTLDAWRAAHPGGE